MQVSRAKKYFRVLFHEFGWNFLRSIAYKRGVFFGGAVILSVIIIAGGFDWFWDRLAWSHLILAYLGLPGLYLGYAFPIALPLIVFTLGLYAKNERTQIAGLALIQTLGVSWGFQSIIKIFTSRELPNIMNIEAQVHSARLDNYSAEFHGISLNVLDGWPSGHMATSLAVAVTFAAFFPKKRGLCVFFYILAAFIGVSVSLNTHWASDVVAGALMGWAAGKVVSQSFTNSRLS
jgi:membrane-associated phospholipid phosphatase